MSALFPGFAICRGICGENCVWIVLRGPTLYSAAFPGRPFRDPPIRCRRGPIADTWRMAVLPPAPQRTVALTTGLDRWKHRKVRRWYSTAWTSPTSSGPCSNPPSARAVAAWARPAVDRSAGRHERRPVGPAHGRAVARPAIALSAYQTCHRRFQLWQRSGRLDRPLQRLAEDLRDRGKIDPSEAFVDATFASAKKGALKSVQRAVAKAPRSWRSATAAVFLSPCTWPALHRMSHTSSPPPSTRASSPTSRGA